MTTNKRALETEDRAQHTRPAPRLGATVPPTTIDDSEIDAIGLTAVLYIRVSTKDQAERDGDPEGYSIPAQREACQRKAAALGANVIAEFVDRGESARSADRPELKRMLAFVASEQITYCIVHKVDRLARSRADDVTINLALKQAGVQLVSVTENIDETPSGILLHGIMSTIAEFYSRNLANEVIKGSVQKAKAGGTPGRAPVGYLNVRRTESGREIRTVELDPERAPIMAWAFEAYATGEWTLRNLLAEVTGRGLTSVAGPKTPSKPLGLSHFHKLLRHPYYAGIVRYRNVLYEGRHEPLVALDTWQKVQDLLAAHNFAGERLREHPHYLKGSVYCGQCGSRLIVCNAKGRRGDIYPYFICVGRQQGRTICTQRAIRIDETEEAVAAYYTAIRLTKDQASEVQAFVLDELARLRIEGKRERGIQDRRLRRLQGERKKLLDAHYAGAIPLELLKSEQNRITTEITSAQDRLAAVDGDYNAAEKNVTMALSLVRDCKAAYRDAPDSLRRQFNQVFFKRLLIDDQYTVSGDLAPPFDTLLSDDLRRAAADRAEQKRRRDVEEVLHGPVAIGFDQDKTRPDRDDLVAVAQFGRGLNNETMVGRRGLEPLTPCVSCKCATNCANGPSVGTLPPPVTLTCLQRAALAPSWHHCPRPFRPTTRERQWTGLEPIRSYRTREPWTAAPCRNTRRRCDPKAGR